MLTDLPNILTLLRIGSIPVLVGLMAFHSPLTDTIACVLYAAACITDYLDGALARRWHLFSELGRMMAPILAKLLVGALLLALAGFAHLPLYSSFVPVIVLPP